jgi:hypothetical protein
VSNFDIEPQAAVQVPHQEQAPPQEHEGQAEEHEEEEEQEEESAEDPDEVSRHNNFSKILVFFYLLFLLECSQELVDECDKMVLDAIAASSSEETTQKIVEKLPTVPNFYFYFILHFGSSRIFSLE